MTKISYRLLTAAVLAWHYGTAGAGPVPDMDSCPDGVRTLETQHTQILTITPVLVSTHCPYDMDLVIDHANTIPCTNAPTDISTIITITNAGSPTMTSLENGAPAKPTETGKLPPPNTVTRQAESAGAPGQNSQMGDNGNSDSRPTGSGASGSGYSKTGHATSNTNKSSVSGGPGSSNSKPSKSLTSNSASITYTSPVSLMPEASSSGNSLTWSPTFSSSVANSSSGTASSEPTSSQSAASPGESSAVEGPQTASSPAESSAESSSHMGILSSESSQTATSQPINTQTETLAETTRTETSRTEVPQSMSSNTEASPTGTSQTGTSQTSQAATSRSAETSPPQSLSASFSSPMTTVTPSATETTITKASSTSSTSADSLTFTRSSTSSSSFTSASSSHSFPPSPPSTSTSSTSSTTSSTSSTCSPAAPTKVCATGLPRPCKDLANLGGINLNILQDAAGCTSALGAFAKDVSQCFVLGPLDLLSPWKKVVNCLQDKMGDVCLPQLPDACTGLAGQSGVNLAANVAACTVQLGPFAVGKTFKCLKGGFVNGDDIVACLRGTTGLGLSTCAPAGPACVSALPPDCNLVGGLNGLDISLSKLEGCARSIGSYGGGVAAKCLDPVAIVQTTLGGGVVACLRDALKDVCMPTLPEACFDLITVSGGQLTTQLPQCIDALGPFKSGAVLDCITKQTSGPGVVLCLNKAIFGS